MPAIDSLMKRLGFVKLSSFGLVLTPEGRILSMRPAVLDDGFGGRIVGWKDGDLAAAELEKWEPARPAPKPAVASRVASSRPPRPPIPTSAAGVVPKAPAVAVAPMVAAGPVVEEDDWEWTIALARARAAAEESQLAAAKMAAAPPRRTRANTVPPPIVAAAPIEDQTTPNLRLDRDGWPKTEPLGAIDYNDYTNPMSDIVRVVRLAETPRVTMPAKITPATPVPVVRPPATAVRPLAPMVPPAPMARPAPAVRPLAAVVVPPMIRPIPRPGTAPATVIPIPRFPSIKTTHGHMAPVVRSALPTPMPPTQPRRFAKGTGPLLPNTDAISEDTVPGFVMPPVAPIVLPSVKRATRG